MTLQKKMTVRCPKCGEALDVEVWPSVNAEESPEAAERLRTGDLFLIRCPKCGNESMGNYSVLYTDRPHRRMIQYVAAETPEEENQSVLEYRAARLDMIAKLRETDPESATEFESIPYRIVLTLNDLREKAIIAASGLDDRYVELVKAYMLPAVRDMRPELGVAEIRFFEDEGKKLLVFLNGDGADVGSCDFDQKSYDAFADGLVFKADDTDMIGPAWAKDVLATLFEKFSKGKEEKPEGKAE
ncbi:MAG: CpXC domain-containing protein [Sutterellaceae bacterium]|nr:CpXC domain-containing protein [Sutterellaceae bacterium]MDD7442848.1 CpXC domain-containing protein [Sutterellaceae bacterium]MDY2868674.1 CpXC domain-containing protein [Mesosutterella sp.]